MIKLHLDLDKQFSDNPMIFIRVADGNADGVQAKITRDSAPVDLTGYSLAFEGITSAGKTVIDNTATGTADGVLSYTFSEQLAQSGGLFKSAYFSLTKGNTRTTTNNFELFVYTGADINGIDPADYINPYNDLIAQLNETYDEATKKVTDGVTSKIKVASDNADAQIKSVTDNATQHTKDLDTQVTALGKKIADYISGKDVEFKEFQSDFDTMMADSKTKVDELLKTAVKSGDQIGGRNLIVHTGELVGQMVSPDGSIAAFDQSNAMKDTISVTAGEWLTFHQEMPNKGVQCFRWAWIDKDGKVISRQSEGSKQIFKVQVPANAVTMRVSYPIIGRVKLERGEVVSDWSDAPEELSGGRNYIQNSKSITIDGDTNHFIDISDGLTPGEWTFSANANYLVGTDTSVIVSVLDQNISDAKLILVIPIVNGRVSQNIHVPDSTHYRLAVYATGTLPDVSGQSPWRTTPGKKLQLTNVMLEKGSVQHDYVPAPEDMVSQTDAVNYQKSTITAPDGGNKYTWFKTSCPDLVAAIQDLPLGYHTFFCQAGVTGNPSTKDIRGTIEVTGANSNGFFGVGNFTDVLGNSWSFFMDNSGWKLNKSTIDNEDNTITVNGKIITPATMDDIQNAVNTVKAYVDSKITTTS